MRPAARARALAALLLAALAARAAAQAPKAPLPTDIPADLYAPPAPAATAPGGAAPPPLVGTLTSLLDPPLGFAPPPLSPEQLAAVPELQKLRQGIATVIYQRAIGPLDGTNFACGLGYLNEHFVDHIVGVPRALYRGGELCGYCVKMWCVDSVCGARALVANATFMIADRCDDCAGENLVVSARGLGWLSGVDYDDNPALQIAWTLAPCGELIESGIKMLPSENNSPVFVGINFSNMKALLRAVTLNGLPMKRTDYGQWVLESTGDPLPLRPPYALALAAVSGEVLRARIAALAPADLGIQFGAGGAAGGGAGGGAAAADAEVVAAG